MNTDDKNMTTQDLIKRLKSIMPLGPLTEKIHKAAADRLEKLQRQVEIEKQRADAHYENYLEMLKRIDVVAAERDEALAQVERLKTELHGTIESYKLNNLQPKTTRQEPTRLEIAAMLVASRFSSTLYVTEVKGTWINYALQGADALIAAAREAK